MSNLATIADNAVVLERCPLFSQLSRDDREVLGRRAYRQEFHVDERLFAFGDPGESMMIILLGSIRISRPTTSDRDLVLGDLTVGEILGEMALLDGKPRSADARAVTNGQVLVLARRDFLPFLESHPNVAMALLGVLCEKIRKADERASDLGFAALSERLAKAILSRIGSAANARLSLSQPVLAEIVGSSRESVNRQLKAWQAEGLIEMKNRWIIVTKPRALLARAKPRS